MRADVAATGGGYFAGSIGARPRAVTTSHDGASPAFDFFAAMRRLGGDVPFPSGHDPSRLDSPHSPRANRRDRGFPEKKNPPEPGPGMKLSVVLRR